MVPESEERDKSKPPSHIPDFWSYVPIILVMHDLCLYSAPRVLLSSVLGKVNSRKGVAGLGGRGDSPAPLGTLFLGFTRKSYVRNKELAGQILTFSLFSFFSK